MNLIGRVLSRIDENVHVLAIDGRAAAGKTTLAKAIAELLGACVIHMDDFFLPLELRSENRFCEAGGNVHYERFMEEVIPFIRGSKPFRYRRFDCSTLTFDEEEILIDPSRMIIVEGAYSLSERFGHYYDLSVFLDIPPDVQIERIMKRNGEEKTEVFRARWIPLEEAYFSTSRVPERSDIILCGCQEEGGSIPS